MSVARNICYDQASRFRDASRGCLNVRHASSKACWVRNSGIFNTRLRTLSVDMSLAISTPTNSANAQIYRVADLFSARAYPVGSAVSHPAYGDGLVMAAHGFDRNVTFQNYALIALSDADRALAAMDGDEAESVMQLTIEHKTLTVSQLRKKISKAMISKDFNFGANRLREFEQLKTRHDNKHYHDSI